MPAAEYKVWNGMIQRCTNPNHHNYRNYGGRGITVCPQWRKSFERFLADIGPRPSPRHTLDRYPNNDGNYEPGNVRWATGYEQRANSRPVMKAKQLREERKSSRVFAQFVKDAGITHRELGELLDLGSTSIELMLNGQKRDPFSACREFVQVLKARGGGCLVPTILAYISGDKEEWEAAMIVGRAVLRQVGEKEP